MDNEAPGRADTQFGSTFARRNRWSGTREPELPISGVEPSEVGKQGEDSHQQDQGKTNRELSRT